MNSSFPILDKEILQQILTSSSDPILITTKNVEIVYVNPAWEKLTGYSLKEVIGKNPRFLKSGKTPARVYKKMWQALLSGKPFTSDEVIDKRKNGYEYRVGSTVYPVIKDSQTIYYVQRQHDITKEKQLEELRKEFLSASAHELKTPITVLKLLTQAHLNKAKKQSEDTIKVSELELIDRELDRLTRLINDMLDTSRFETGKQFMTYEEINLTDLINKTVQKIQIYAKNHKVTVNKLPNNIKVIADSTRIEQVLLNLLSNAVKYSPNNKDIMVTLTLNNNKAVVSVRDEGMGITKSKQKLIFDRYYQVKAKNKIGFGLGLYISKEIIKRHKGKIWVESQKGKGSTFFFTLPLSAIDI